MGGKHTPGPWFAGPLTNDGWDEDNQMVSVGTYSLADRPNKDHHYEDAIADVHQMNGNDALANAQLIAAAPALLADVLEAERMFRWYGDMHALKPDMEKAARNYAMADRLAATITLATATSETEA